MKRAFDAASLKSKEQKEELQPKLSEGDGERAAQGLAAELDEPQAKVESFILVEKPLTEEVTSLKGKLECNLLKLCEVTGARDASNERAQRHQTEH